MTTAAMESPDSTQTPNPYSSGDGSAGDDAASTYRALHSGAVVGPVAAVVCLFFPYMVAASANFAAVFPLVGLPIVALGVSLWGVSAIRANREYYTGLKPALIAAVVAALSLFGGVGYGGYVYATEVPPGYVRTSFLAMKPSDEDERQHNPIPPAIRELRGKKIFIKGYMRPDSTKSRVNNKEFLLVRDANECCFGDLSTVAFFDQIQIKLTGGETADLRPWPFSIGGTIDWRLGNKRRGEPLIVYSIKSDYIK